MTFGEISPGRRVRIREVDSIGRTTTRVGTVVNIQHEHNFFTARMPGGTMESFKIIPRKCIASAAKGEHDGFHERKV